MGVSQLAWSALSSPLYQTYCNLYEEVKCVGVKVQACITTPIGGAEIPAVEVVTAWDRRFKYGEEAVDPGFDGLSTYGNSQQWTAVNNSVAKFTRRCYASDLMEKAQWHDCQLNESGATIYDTAYVAASTNPNFFCPALLCAFRFPGLAEGTKSLNVSLNIRYYFTFRNPGFGASAASKMASQVKSASGDIMMDDILADQIASLQLELEKERAINRANATKTKKSSKIVVTSPGHV